MASEAVIDPDRTNQTGGDGKVFLDGDRVASVVNGTVPANLIQAPRTLTLVDDWTAADYLFDAEEAAKVRVYEADAGTDRESSVSDIANRGRDITDQWDITIDGTVVTATAKASYLTGLKGLAKARQITMLVPGRANYANGAGAGQVRDDFGIEADDEITFCTAGKNGAELTNAGSQTINTHTVETNEPKVCGYVPPVVKDVVGESSQGGAQDSVDGKIVFPGQRLEYRLETQPHLPDSLAYTIVEVAVTDTYDEHFSAPMTTVLWVLSSPADSASERTSRIRAESMVAMAVIRVSGTSPVTDRRCPTCSSHPSSLPRSYLAQSDMRRSCRRAVGVL